MKRVAVEDRKEQWRMRSTAPQAEQHLAPAAALQALATSDCIPVPSHIIKKPKLFCLLISKRDAVYANKGDRHWA